jgi:hypothetical protein
MTFEEELDKILRAAFAMGLELGAIPGVNNATYEPHAERKAILQAIAKRVPEKTEPRLIDAANEAYERVMGSAAQFRNGFDIGQDILIRQFNQALGVDNDRT